MYGEITIESTDTEEELGLIFEPPIQEVSISSIKTQDSIINNSMIMNVDHEEYKEFEVDFRNFDHKESHSQLTPFLSLKEAQQEVIASLGANRIRIEIKPLHEISKNLHKLCESFQMWRKQD